MVHEDFHGAIRHSPDPYCAWRCIICGEVIDNVITVNRQLKRALEKIGD